MLCILIVLFYNQCFHILKFNLEIHSSDQCNTVLVPKSLVLINSGTNSGQMNKATLNSFPGGHSFRASTGSLSCLHDVITANRYSHHVPAAECDTNVETQLVSVRVATDRRRRGRLTALLRQQKKTVYIGRSRRVHFLNI